MDGGDYNGIDVVQTAVRLMVDAEQYTCEMPEFWEGRYRENVTPWDLGQPAPPFATLIRERREEFLPGKMAVLGAGAGHDAAFFGQNGFEVVGFDYAEGAIERATARYGQWVNFVQANIFEIPEAYRGTFDYVLEHTCFCAIPMERRRDYVEAARRLLKPEGRLIGLFWCHQEEGGPPFKTDRQELETLFSPYFRFESVTVPESSAEGRRGQELLCILRRIPE